MTIRNLQFLFKPKSVALIGASKQPGSVGALVARNLFRSGFDGPVMPVNPKGGTAFGLPGHMRLSYAASNVQLEDAVGRIQEFCSRVS